MTDILDSILQRKTPKGKKLLMPVRQIFGVSPKTGDIGIEIECEGNKFQKNSLPHPWKYEHDGSLRGQDNAEYILKKPISFEKVPEALDILWEMFSNYGTVLDESDRTSVHVHLNAQSFLLNRLCSFTALYFIVEELLTDWCGDHRVGNLFCLRAKDAPAIVSELAKFFCEDGGHPIGNSMHYSGLNVHALVKYGSIEVRGLRGVTDPAIIKQWVSILERLYKLSAEYEDPRKVVEGFSGAGPVAFLQNILGDNYYPLMKDLNKTPQELRDSLYEGVRIAQDLCYCRDWQDYIGQTALLDPFGREEVVVTPLNDTPTTHMDYESFATSVTSTNSLLADLPYITSNTVQNTYQEFIEEYGPMPTIPTIPTVDNT